MALSSLASHPSYDALRTEVDRSVLKQRNDAEGPVRRPPRRRPPWSRARRVGRQARRGGQPAGRRRVGRRCVERLAPVLSPRPTTATARPGDAGRTTWTSGKRRADSQRAPASGARRRRPTQVSRLSAPHRDDVELQLLGDRRLPGTHRPRCQGEQRSLALALRLAAHRRGHRRHRGRRSTPCLLDDVLSASSIRAAATALLTTCRVRQVVIMTSAERCRA